jgi:hypothetical protein
MRASSSSAPMAILRASPNTACPCSPMRIDGFKGPLAGSSRRPRLGRRRIIPRTKWMASVTADTPFLPDDLIARLHAARAADNADLAVASSGGRIGITPSRCGRVALRDDMQPRAVRHDDNRGVGQFAARIIAYIVAHWPAEPRRSVLQHQYRGRPRARQTASRLSIMVSGSVNATQSADALRVTTASRRAPQTCPSADKFRCPNGSRRAGTPPVSNVVQRGKPMSAIRSEAVEADRSQSERKGTCRRLRGGGGYSRLRSQRRRLSAAAGAEHARRTRSTATPP